MSVLAGYVIRSILRSVGLVLTVLVGVATLFSFVSQLDDIGEANFGSREAILFVILQIPRLVVDVLPAATLLGALLGLGNLATKSELIAIRAAGVSKLQVIAAVGICGIALSGINFALGESLAPSLGAYARQMRSEALLDEMEFADGRSSWFKDDEVVVNLRRGFSDDGDSGLYLYEVSPERGLLAVAHADSVESADSSTWILNGFAETRFAADRLSASRTRAYAHELDLNADLLSMSEMREYLLDMPNLQRYIEYLRRNQRDDRRYVIAYWSRWASAVSVPFMALLAVPFVFGSLRSVGSGARLVVGLCIGLGFFVADQVLQNSGVVYEFDPIWVAWTPTAGLVVITAIAALRAR